MNRKLFTLIMGMILILAALTGCKGAKSKTPVVKPTSIPKPESNKGTVTGNVFSTSANKPYPKAAVWLAEVYRQGEKGAFILDHAFSPAVYADEKGVFTIANVEPKEYVIVIGDPEANYEVIQDNTGVAAVWNVEGGKILDVGKLDTKLSP